MFIRFGGECMTERALRPAAASTRRLWTRDYSILWAGMFQSHLGSAFLEIGLMWLAYEKSGSPAVVGTILALEGIPMLFGPLAGVVVDRSSKRLLLIGSDLVRGMSLLLVFFLHHGGLLQLWHLYGLVIILGSAAVPYHPSVTILLPTLVGDEALPAANSFMQVGRRSATIAGASLAGIALAVVGAPTALLIDGISFLIAAFAISLLRFKTPLLRGMSLRAGEVVRDLLEGLRFLIGTGELIALVAILFMVNLVLTPVNVIFPVFSNDVLGQGVTGFGFLAAALAVGLLLGSLLAAALGDRLTYTWAILVALLSLSALLTALSLTETLAPAFVLVTGIGMATALVQVPLLSHLQRTVPQQLQGRVFATIDSLGTLALPLGAGLAGQALLLLKVPVVFRAAAVGILSVALIWLAVVLAGKGGIPRYARKAPAGNRLVDNFDEKR